MKDIKLIIPQIEDLWFRESMLSDCGTMSYNAGYKPIYEGYHYDSGCIDFPKEKWERWRSEKMSKMLYFFIKDEESGHFVGEVSCRRAGDCGYIGIIIHSKFRGQGYMKPAMIKLADEAKKAGLSSLIDEGVPLSRTAALKCFYDLGFKIIKKYKTIKFDSEDDTVDIQLLL